MLGDNHDSGVCVQLYGLQLTNSINSSGCNRIFVV